MVQVLRLWAHGKLHYPTSYEVVQNHITGQATRIRFRDDDGTIRECKPEDAMAFTGSFLCEIPLFEGDILRYREGNVISCGVIRESSTAAGTYEVHSCGNPVPRALSECLALDKVLLAGNVKETANAALLLLSVTVEATDNTGIAKQTIPENESVRKAPKDQEPEIRKVSEDVIHLYTDGCCLVNPGGDGGWAFAKIENGKSTSSAGYLPECTNNIAELTAVIEGLKSIPGSERNIIIYSDSQYVINGFNKGWLKNWKRNGWVSSSGSEVKNIGLWTELDVLSRRHNCEWVWVKGHASNEYNNLCDKLAGQAATRREAINQ